MLDAEWLTFGNYTFSLRSLAFFYLDRLLEFTPSKMSVNLVQDDMLTCRFVRWSKCILSYSDFAANLFHIS